ncbi:hypothetical protein [Mucilaginibacter sp. NFR10]|uniref:hypothetical protein n=1 Tax=Mucilaginibacter sp. NFR10 TaxID=1566292 RepID=UPI0008719952|nr:hypothetical protein [Mucilaginibacter sp. NFR10]SCW38315.1 hypothetical protein SAMN03159284_00130 [Mucilaginibacter sp. NFR10]
MNICYLCGENMIERTLYDADPNAFDIKPKLKHDEHILQDAIYGRLIANDILCETCGSKLSTEIDADFVKIFQTLTEQFSSILASKTKGNNFVRSLHGHVILKNQEKIEVFIKEGKIFPSRPFYDQPENGIVKVYGEEKTAKQFVNKAKSDLKKSGVDIETLKFEVVNDLQDHVELGINFSEGIEDFNKKFKMGFVKIATGFAAKNGVSREHLTNAIDTKTNKFVDVACLVPFVGWDILNLIYDPLRLAIEPEYPTHTLILYVDKSAKSHKLVCYIDLFSTFQYYVILNNDYKGPDVHDSYYQTITRLEKPEVNIKATRPKHLLIVQELLGVKHHETSGMNLEQLYDYLEQRYAQWNVTYQLDLGTTLKGVCTKLIMNIIASQTGKTDLLTGLEKELADAMPTLDGGDFITLQQEFTRIENGDPAKFYRQNYLEFEASDGISIVSTLHKMVELQHEKPELFPKYNHAKFYQLQHFIANNKV